MDLDKNSPKKERKNTAKVIHELTAHTCISPLFLQQNLSKNIVTQYSFNRKRTRCLAQGTAMRKNEVPLLLIRISIWKKLEQFVLADVIKYISTSIGIISYLKTRLGFRSLC